MESYLIREDLWDFVAVNGVVALDNVIENVEARKWKQKKCKCIICFEKIYFSWSFCT